MVIDLVEVDVANADFGNRGNIPAPLVLLLNYKRY